MPTYRRSDGNVTRSHLRVRVGGSTMGAGRRLRTPLVDPPPVPTGTMTYAAEPLGAGGWVTGLTISPDGNTRLVRTDTMGAWRWDTTADAWVAAITGTSMPAGDIAAQLDSGQGVHAIAAANSVAFMGYRSSIYKSVDKGVTWTASLASGPTTAPNSGDQRWWNTRMAFDPANAAKCIYGTVAGGLYYTTNTGSTWTQVSSGSVPFGGSGIGIPCVAVDGSGNWYAAPYGNGVYRSTDSGSTWTKISSDAQFVVVTGMQAGPNGDLMVTGHTSTNLVSTTSVVYRYRSGVWANITPTGNNNDRKWRTIAYDPFHPGRVLVQGDGGYERLSQDYGDTWPQPWHTMASGAEDVPWLAAANGFGANFFFVTLGGLQFDPAVSGRVWMSQGIGVWRADLATLAPDPIPWQAQSRGVEQLVTNDVLCPPGGPPVVVSWDRSVFLAGEAESVPYTSIPTPQPVPVGTGGSLGSVVYRGFPPPITHAWTVVSKPVASSGGTFTAPTAAATAFVPDATGTYVLRLTSTNSIGSHSTDVTLTATTAITGLILPGSTGNYLQTPADSSLDITGDLTLVAKLSLADWAPSVETAIIGKYGSTQRSYLLTVTSTGLKLYLSTSVSGSTGRNAATLIPLTFPPGSVQWVRLIYAAAARTATLSTSPDGTTWTDSGKPIDTSFGIPAGTPLAVSSAPLTVGWAGSLAGSAAMSGRVYRAQVYSGATLVADFNAEGITRTGARTPGTYTGTTGKVWTPQGTGWDWSA